MAGDAIVGALRVVLGMDTASFEDGAKKAASQISHFGETVKAIFTGAALAHLATDALEKIGHSLLEGVKHSIEFADQMGKTAQKVGISVEQFSGLRVAAEVSGVSMESLTVGLGKLSKNIEEASRGTGKAKDEFRALGINVRDSSGNVKSAGDVLLELSDKTKGASDGAVKTAAALQLMGRGGKELIPLLNQGSGAIREFTEMAERMGLIVTKEAAEQSRQFTENLKILKLATEGLFHQVAEQLLPALVNLSNQFVTTAKEGTNAKNTAHFIADSLKEIVLVGGQAVVIITFLRDAFKDWLDIRKKVGEGGEIKQEESLLRRVWESIKAIDQASSEGAWGPPKEAQNSLAQTSEKGKELAEQFEKMRNAILDAFRLPPHITVAPALKEMSQAASELQKELDELALKTKINNQAFNNLAPGLPEMAAKLNLIAKNGSDLKNSISSLSPALVLANNALKDFLQSKITQENLTPWELYEQKVAILKATFGGVGEASDAFKRQSLKNAAEVANAYATAAQSIVSPIASAFKELSQMNSKYAGFAKAAAIAEATVNIAVAATKALATLGPIFGPAAAAAIVAAGAVHIAVITKTAFPTATFASGGEFKVGGVGGVDSQLVQFAATPGEMVDVRKPGQTTGPVSEITVNMRGRDLISRDMVGDLFAALNEGTRDGYRLKLAGA